MELNEAMERAFKYWVLKKSRIYKLIKDGDIPSEKVRDDDTISVVYKHHAETPDGNKSITLVQQIEAKMRTIEGSVEISKDEIEEWRNKGFDPTDAPDALLQSAISFAMKFDDGAIVDFKEWKSLIPDLPVSEGKHLIGSLFEIPCVHCSHVITVQLSDKFATCPKCGKDNLIIAVKNS